MQTFHVYLERKKGLYWLNGYRSEEQAHIAGIMAMEDSPEKPLDYHVFHPGNKTPYDDNGRVRHFIPRP